MDAACGRACLTRLWLSNSSGSQFDNIGADTPAQWLYSLTLYCMKYPGTNYSTFTGRPRKAITVKPAKSILDSESLLSLQADNFYRFSDIYITRARQLAQAGQKDEARDWYRFFQNSGVISLLEKNGSLCNLGALRENLNFLGLECHPLDVPDFRTDIQAIRNCLEVILTHVKKNPASTKSVSPFASRRTVNRHHGNY